MSSELMRMTNGDIRPRKQDRELVRQADKVKAEVQLADYQAAGTFALAAKIMQGAAELDDVRLQLAAGDPVKAAMLADFEVTAFQKAKNIQRGLFNDFGL
jgi:phosphate-selective porin